MTNLILVPIEPLEERYTGQWYKYLPSRFKQAGFNVKVIDGIALQETIKVGTFLDINSTVHYKMSQLMEIAKLFDVGAVKDGTVFFFSDIEFWGLESVRLMAQMNGVKVKIGGFLHAASHTRGDAFSVANNYQKHTEIGWVKAVDYVFCGTEYAKRSFLECHDLEHEHEVVEKFVVSGNPLFHESYLNVCGTEKQKLVLLTNRFDAEKNVGETLQLFTLLKLRNPDWRFCILTGRQKFTSNCESSLELALELQEQGVLEIHAGLTKEQYHGFLHSAAIMVSNSPEENFGYCVVEAALYGCAPLLYDSGKTFADSSHRELVRGDAQLLFSSTDEAIQKAEYLMRVHKDVQHIARPYLSSADIIADSLK
jgi:glycosyltransferase involved in cell wall biosynthesis